MLSIIGYYKILNIAPYATQEVLVGYFMYIRVYMFNSKLLIYPSCPSPFGDHKFIFCL